MAWVIHRAAAAAAEAAAAAAKAYVVAGTNDTHAATDNIYTAYSQLLPFIYISKE